MFLFAGVGPCSGHRDSEFRGCEDAKFAFALALPHVGQQSEVVQTRHNATKLLEAASLAESGYRKDSTSRQWLSLQAALRLLPAIHEVVHSICFLCLEGFVRKYLFAFVRNEAVMFQRKVIASQSVKTSLLEERALPRHCVRGWVEGGMLSRPVARQALKVPCSGDVVIRFTSWAKDLKLVELNEDGYRSYLRQAYRTSVLVVL